MQCKQRLCLHTDCRAPLINAVYKCSYVTYIPTVVISYIVLLIIHKFTSVFEMVLFWTKSLFLIVLFLINIQYVTIHRPRFNMLHEIIFGDYFRTLEHTSNAVIWYRNNASCMEIPQYNRNSADKRNHYHDGENL